MSAVLGRSLGRIRLDVSLPLSYVGTFTRWPQCGLLLLDGQAGTHCESQHDSLLISHNLGPVTMEHRDGWDRRSRQSHPPGIMVHAPGTRLSMGLLTTGRFLNLFVGAGKLAAIVGEARMPLAGAEGGHASLPDACVQHLLRALLADAEADCPVGPTFGETVIAAVVSRVYGLAAIETGRNGLTRGQLDRIRAFVDANIGGNLSLQQMADELNLSVRQFCRSFRASTNLSPHQYIIRYRLQLVCKHLIATNFDLAMIAEIVGFSNQSQMATTFRRAIGMTPSHFRHAHASSQVFGFRMAEDG